jgi:hypothetical protein
MFINIIVESPNNGARPFSQCITLPVASKAIMKLKLQLLFTVVSMNSVKSLRQSITLAAA